MPYPTGYSAPLVGPLGQQGNNTPENAGWDNGIPYMNVGGQRVTVPMQNGFPTWNAAYNIYGNPSAAQARYNQIGQTNPNAGTSTGMNTGMPNIPTIPTAGAGGGVGGVGGVGGTSDGVTRSLASTSPSIESITNLVNTLNRQSQQQANNARIPGAAGLEQQSSNNIGSLLGGNIPADVLRVLGQNAAERGIAMGSPGSDNNNSALLRSLGLTSLDLQGRGQQYLSAADARNPGAPIYDAGNQVLTAGQKAQQDAENARLALDWYRTLHPNYGGYGGRGGGYPSGGGGGYSSGSALPSWFPTLGGTPSSGSIAPPSYSGGVGGPTTTSTTTPGGSTYVNTGQDWGDLFGDTNVGGTVPNDASNPDYWNWNQPPPTYDPFGQY